MILGRPSGSSRIPAVTIEVPPPPPMPMMPAMSSRPAMNRWKAAAIAATARPRSPEASASAVPSGPNAATSAAETSGVMVGGVVPTSTISGRPPAASTSPARYASSSPLVSAVPTT